METEVLKELISRNRTKIIFLIMDGLGGLPQPGGKKTELEMAHTPTFDQWAKEGICGLLDPISPGITPGSGPAHLGLFGYDPLQYNIGRGVLSALGVDFQLTPRDVAARLNFCSIDDNGLVVDRRAGRIPTALNLKLCEKIRKSVKLDDEVEYFIETESEHRAVLILRGDGLGGDINDTDPQQTGIAPQKPQGMDTASQKTAGYVREFLSQVQNVLRGEHPANMILMRGFARYEPLPTFETRYGLQACAIAQYPMYRGLARLVGMDVLHKPANYEDMWQLLRRHYQRYDFFFIHFKKTDTYGEDGDFEAKVKVIEEVDGWASQILNLKPDVVLVTGDHSTPTRLKSHSWHPVPVVLWSEYCRPDSVTTFGESACAQGALGRLLSKHILMIALANALRFKKFGA